MVEVIKRIKQSLAALAKTKIGTYDPGVYWESRHAIHADDRAVANELEPEKQRYDQQRNQFLNFLKSEDVSLKGSKCIEFGCGNGFWAETVLIEGASEYVGLDISKTAVQRCSAKNLPNTRFDCLDASAKPIESHEKYDVGLSIDVTQHIVDERKLQIYLLNLQSSVKLGGYIVVTSYTSYGDRYKDEDPTVNIAGVFKLPKLRWVHTWDWQTLQRLLPGCELMNIDRFWDKAILLFRRNESERGQALNQMQN
jgi:2-polyprenyl-3-methyl-5-hydroxy-6-metoxy-1,4-benzoquinol methylase